MRATLTRASLTTNRNECPLMATVYSRSEIERVIDPAQVIAAMERAFSAYSRGEAVIPPVGQLDFVDPPGDCHIKYGYLEQGTTFTVKIATGFWKNPERGLPSGNGVVLLFSKSTGELLTIFQDEGYLTDCRTAAAGAVAAKYLAPEKIDCIAIIGAGVQARLQLDYLRHVTSCRRVKVWARAGERARALAVTGFDIEVSPSPARAVAGAQLIDRRRGRSSRRAHHGRRRGWWRQAGAGSPSVRASRHSRRRQRRAVRAIRRFRVCHRARFD
jgi:ornithine cyclodeaminase